MRYLDVTATVAGRDTNAVVDDVRVGRRRVAVRRSEYHAEIASAAVERVRTPSCGCSR